VSVKDQLGLTQRKKVMGLPVGPKQTNWSKVAKLGAGAAATAASARGASRAKNAVGGVADRGKDLVGQVTGTVEKATGGEGGDGGVVGKVKDLGDRASAASEAAEGHSTGIGKAFAAVKAAVSGGSGQGYTSKQRLIIQEQIDIAVPRRDVYDQWTQFEDFTDIFRAVEEVSQEDDETTQWQAKMLVSRRSWKAEIKEQIPDQRIVWESSGDVQHKGVVTFHELDDNLTRVQVEMEYKPTGFVEKFGNLFLTVRHRVRKDLRLYKHHLEFENEATGAWRGTIGEDAEDGGDDEERDEEASAETEADSERAEDEGDEARADDDADEDDEDEDDEDQPRSGKRSSSSSRNGRASSKSSSSGNGRARKSTSKRSSSGTKSSASSSSSSS
jgi:uncharacterized membrane protein